jgi:hypothetical protein
MTNSEFQKRLYSAI